MLSLPKLKSFNAPLLIFMLIGTSGPATSTPRYQGAIGMSGRVSPCVKLSVGKSSLPQSWQQQAASTGVVATTESLGLDAMLVVLSGSAPTPAIELALPLEIRTNVAYELKLTLVSVEGCGPDITASVRSIRASGPSVSAAAVGAARGGSLDLGHCSSPTTSLRGPRASAGGNFGTSGNALLADLALSIPSNAQQCYWRVTFRISLHPSA